jgi:hypothetical protein
MGRGRGMGGPGMGFSSVPGTGERTLASGRSAIHSMGTSDGGMDGSGLRLGGLGMDGSLGGSMRGLGLGSRGAADRTGG